jgi:hypothetical protein
MKSSRIGDSLFGIPDKPLTREERIEIIRQRVHDETYLTQERLDKALEQMLDEIRDS